MPRGSSSRGRRSDRRAEARRQAQGVNEALDLTAAANDAVMNDLTDAMTEAIPDDVAADLAELARLASDDVQMDLRDTLVAAAGITETVEPLSTFELTQGSLAERKFLSTAIDAGFNEMRGAQWPSEGELADHGEVLFRDGDSGVFRMDDGTIVYAHLGHGWCNIRIAAGARSVAASTMQAFNATYPPLYRDESEDGTIVPITFWTNTSYGPRSRLRMIDSATWADIEGNYTADVRQELDRLMTSFEPGKDGQLLLWQGSPGTGKTWALRALASEWKDWAEFSYITDPDSFFVSDPSYMIDVLLHESYETLTTEGDLVTDSKPEGKWRVLILEDTGELLSANAKEAYGQGLSRLLNVVDGMVGQGLRVLALLTTNDELGDLHPAAVRPGRCASQLSFGPLAPDEAQAWLAARQIEAAPEDAMSLAELYAAAGDSVEAFAEAMDGACANCEHQAMAHEGDMNDGACSVENCSCGAFEEMPSEGGESDQESVTASVAFRPLFTAAGMHYATVWGDGRVTLAGGNDANATLVTSGFGDVPAGTLTNFQITPSQTFADAPPSGDGVVITPPLETAGASLKWTADFAPEGRPTDDGRIFAPGSIEWRELPLTLMAMLETQDGHDGAQVCGRIDAIWRDEDAGMIRAAGEFDSGTFGAEIARLVDEKVLRGVSVDIAVSEMEVAYRNDVLDEDGRWKEQTDDEGEGPSVEDLFGGEGDVLFVVRKGVIGASTVCPFPAFAEAKIEIGQSLVASVQAPMVWTATGQAGFVVTERALVASAAPEAATEPGTEGEAHGGSGDALTASAAGLVPDAPPAEWFHDPEFDELTPHTVTDDGRVFGHAAAWGVCHIGIPGVCTTAPESHSDYAYFHLKEVVCDDGSRVSCGTITLDTNHADGSIGRAAAMAHYDDTGTAVADIVVGEDEYGIWYSGALRPDVDADKARKLRGASLSGDWRDVNGNLELVGLLSVNVPGFPVPRTRAMVASANNEPHVMSLVAAGVVDHDGHAKDAQARITVDDSAALALMAIESEGE